MNDTNIRETNEVHSTTVQPNSGTQTPRAPNLYQAFLSKTKEREPKHGHYLGSHLNPPGRLCRFQNRSGIDAPLRRGLVPGLQ